MEAKLRTDTITYLKHVLDTSISQEETMESIVPDAYPDIQAIVDVGGNVTLRAKEAGAGRVSLNGMIAASVLYLPEGEDGLRSINLSIPFTTGCDAAAVTDETEVTVTVKLAGIDARVINSRKVLVRADVLAEVRGYVWDSMVGTTDIDGHEDAGIRLRQEGAELSFITQIREKTFVVAEEFALPPGRASMGGILKSRVRLEEEDVKNVGNKLIFKGIADIRVLYAAHQTAEPHVAEFTAGFSQIIELDGEGDGAQYEIALALTNVYVEADTSEGGGVSAELHIIAQVVEKRMQVIPYIADAYSTRFELETKHIEHHLESCDAHLDLSTELRETIDVPVGVVRIVDHCVKTGRVQINQEGGRIIFRTPVNVSVIYMTEEGRLSGAHRRFEAVAEMDVMPHVSYGAMVRAVEDAQIMPTGDGMELRVSIVFAVRPCRKVRFATVGEIAWDEESPRDLAALPSIVVYTADGGESLWHLAKRYCSTEELILSANAIAEENAPYPGQLFIIPKAR